MVGPWFTTPWQLVSQSHGAVAWRFRSPIPSHVPFLLATSHQRPLLSVPWVPYPTGLLCGPIPSLIPCLYPTGPPATLWRGPTGSSSIQGPFRAHSTGCSLPAPAPFPCAVSRHPSRPIPRAPRLPILLGLLRGPSHTPFSVPSPFPIIPCSYPTGPPATFWRGPTGSCSIWGPFRVPSTGRSLPSSFRLVVCLLWNPWWVLLPGPHFPRYPCPFPTWSPAVAVFFSRASRDLLSAWLLLPVPPLPGRSVLYALWWCCGVFFFVCPPLSRCASCLVVPSSLHARTSALHRSSGHGSSWCSFPVPSPSLGVALGGPRPCQVGAPPSRLSSLSPLLPPLSSVSCPPSYCCCPATCALRRSSPRQGCIPRALTRLRASALSSNL